MTACLVKLGIFKQREYFMSLLPVMEKTITEKKVGQRGKKLDILRKNFRHFRILL